MANSNDAGRMAWTNLRIKTMKTYNNLYNNLCSYDNLFIAYKKARKGKIKKDYVIEFEKNLNENIKLLREELLFHSYKPKPLKTFIIRDPKTRKISKSAFRDRIVHHALINIIEPIFDKTFIYDSCANRKGKGTSLAIERLTYFHRKITKSNNIQTYFLKADIKHYFQEVNHKILLNMIERRITDYNIISLIKLILKNYKNKEKGMPLGNLTSQFFANVYLNELDYFVKHKLKAKYYIRYVDDFVILHKSKEQLEEWKEDINNFLRNRLKIELHKDKSKIILIDKGIPFLGFRNFYHYKILRKNKIRLLRNKIDIMTKEYKETKSYENLMKRIESIFSHLEIANTFYLRRMIINKISKEIEE